VTVVAKHELSPAPLDHMPLAGVKHRLELIQASGRSRPVTIAMPGKPTPAAQPQAQPVQGSERDQDDRQAGDGHEEHHSHTWLTHRATRAYRADVLVPQLMCGDVVRRPLSGQQARPCHPAAIQDPHEHPVLHVMHVIFRVISDTLDGLCRS